MQASIRILVISLLICVAGAGVQHHDPQDLQSAFNLFNWIKTVLNLGSDGSGNNNPTQSFENGIVTLCPPNIVFVLDGSDSVSPNGFQLAKGALVREIRAVTRAFARTDVGVILFSDVTEEQPLQNRTPQQLEALIQQVNNFVQPRRKTSIPTALRRARQLLLDYSVSDSRAYNGDRSGMVIVLLSDGNPDNERATIQEAKIAKDRGILLITLSLEDAYLTLLKDISHLVQEYRTAIDWPSLVACPEKDLVEVPRGSECRDFLLVVDGSDSVLIHQETVRQYLAYTALRYRLVANAIGVNIFGTDSQVQAADTRIRLQEDKYGLADKIRLNLMFPTTGGTGTDRAISQSVGILNDNIRNRPSSLILITDGPTINRTATRDAIQNARSSGYPVIIIRIGTAMTDEELYFISGGNSSDVFSVARFTDLFAVQFDNQTCGLGQGPCPLSALSCQAPRVFNQLQCACVCPTSCPEGKTHDSSCECACQHKCPYGQLQGANCACYCPTTCPAGTTQLTNCSCTPCPYTCENGQFQDSWCACQCSNVCPSNLRRGPNCACLCPADNLPPGPGGDCNRVLNCNTTECPRLKVPRVGNNGTCECVCQENHCPYNANQTSDCGCVCLDPQLTYNPNTNQCDRICTNVCGPRQAPDLTDKCRCACSNQCPGGQFPDISQDCNCVCSNMCPVGQIGDPNNNCNCVCSAGCRNGQLPSVSSGCQCGVVCSNLCPPGQAPNQANSCRCECTTNTCRAPHLPDPNNGCRCQCPVPSACPPSITSQNVDTCACDCLLSNRVYNSSSRTCDCRNGCPNGQAPNPNNNCQCSCSNVCPDGQAPNPSNNCQCSCPNVCPDGQAPNPGQKCACQCTSNRCPPAITTQNPNTCQCDCLNTLLVYNPATVICGCRNNCSNGRTPNPSNGCQCECPVNTCPTATTFQNTNTCSCQCLNSALSYNPTTRTCGCANSCPIGLAQNPNDCSCSCTSSCPSAITRQNSTTNAGSLSVPDRCVNSCQNGQAPDPNNCNCVCINRCLPGQTQHPNSCECTCPNNCPPAITRQDTTTCGCLCHNSGQVYNPSTLLCGCNNTCSNGRTPNPSNRCQCECPVNTCPTATTFQNTDTCSCQCLNSALSYNPTTRTCGCNNTCSNGRTPNPSNRCQCECPVNTCPTATTFQNTDTCSCQCLNSALSYNPTTRTCGCNNTCSNGRTPNPSNRCQCECPVNTCPTGTTFQNTNTCSCQCLNSALSYNPTTRTCGCVNSCQNGQAPDPNNCSCVCPNRCLPGQTQHPNSCECTCPNTCPSAITRQDTTTCGCLCHNSDQIYNPSTLLCGCNNTCSNGRTPNPSNRCQCECPVNTCPTATTFQNTDTCSCQCLNSALSYNPTTRTCGCNNTCSNGRTPNPSNGCQCECPVNTCPTGTTFQNTDTCSCQCLNSALSYNPTTRTCGCVNSCQNGQAPDPNNCSCVCPNRCLPGQTQHPNSCECTCPNTCPSAITRQDTTTCGCLCHNSDQIYNPSTLLCGCNNTCSNGRTPNPSNRCQCECPVNTCPTATTFQNTDTCSCQCLNSALSYNPTTRTCGCNNTCSNGRTPNPSNGCQCECPVNTCPTGTTFQNTDTCSCQCLNSALSYNTTTRTCGCVNSCQNGQAPDPNNCSCVCPNRCLPGQTQHPNSCECTCPNTCPSAITRQDTTTCGCLCHNSDQIYNPSTLLCGCNNTCSNGRTPNPSNRCQCECPVNTCPTGTTFQNTDTCSCQCLNSALSYNPTTRTCGCNNTCSNGRTPNPSNRCQCECPVNTCPTGTTFQNTDTCSCQCLNSALSYNPTTRTCGCVNSCQNGQAPDPNNCSCVCPNRCLPGQTQHPSSCECICPNTCPSAITRQDTTTCGCLCHNSDQIYNPSTLLCGCNNTCSNGRTPNPSNRCQCECPVNTCPTGTTFQNTDTCSCQCLNSALSYNPTTRTCGCNNTCSNGRTPNPSNRCQCECPVNTCPTGTTFQNTDTCSCQCLNSALSYNPTTRTCGCVNSCQNGQAPDPNNCSCVCPNRCLPGQTQHPNSCECTCPNTCPSAITRQDTTTCGCLCHNSDQIYNPSTLLCGCNNTCSNGRTPNPSNRCQCECPVNTCPTGTTFQNTDTCSCQCLNSALSYNPTTRTCGCNNTCSNGRTPNPSNGCQCECPVNTCPTGTTFQNTDTCSCQCLNSALSYNPTTRTCGCVNSCQNGQAPDPNNCSCVCPNRCLPGQTQHPNSCECTCPNTCPSAITRQDTTTCGCLCHNSDQIYNPSTLLCGCNNTCSNGRTPNPSNGCQCECPVNTCPTGTTFQNTNTCSCQCLNSALSYNPTTRTCGCGNRCQNGQSQNPNTCTCSCSNTCPSGKAPNPSNGCTCECSSNSCPAPYTTQNPTTCDCQCLNTSLSFNPTTYTCDRVLVPCNLQPQHCPFPKVPSFIPCECACPRKCPTTAIQNGNCDCQCLNSNLRYDSGTNQCVPQSCTQTCPTGAILNTDCSCTCPIGTSFNTTTGTCDQGRQVRICPNNKLTCENGQVAYEDCNGDCFCACSAGFAGARCEIIVHGELCNDCHYDNGHYYAGVQGYCDIYVQCVPLKYGTNRSDRPTEFTAFVMPCPPGTLYIIRPDGWRGCDHPGRGHCAYDRCNTMPAKARYSDMSGCQSYFQCGDNRALVSRVCCPNGQGYNPVSSKCEVNTTCPITCGRSTTVCKNPQPFDAACPFGVNPSNHNEYFHKLQPGTPMKCPETLVMDLNVCTCVPGTIPRDRSCQPVVDLNFNQQPVNSEEDRVPRISSTNGLAADFNGTNNYILKAFSGSGFWTDYFQINLRLHLPRPIVGGPRTAVVSNADCNVTESVSITMDGTNCYFQVFQMNSNQSVEIAIPYLGLADASGWYSITLRYKRVGNVFEFSGQIGNNRQIYTGPISLTTNIDMRTCALHIGYGYLYTGLVGHVDDFQIWRCDPTIPTVL